MLIRPATDADAAGIRAVYAPSVAEGVASFEAEVPPVDEMLRRMHAPPRKPWFVADDGGVAGYAYASTHNARAAYRWSVNVSVYVAPEHHGRGVGRSLYERLFAELRGLGHVSAFAGIALPNPGSVRLHESCGFRRVGVHPHTGFKFGRWWDVAWYHLALREPPERPGEPRAWEP